MDQFVFVVYTGEGEQRVLMNGAYLGMTGTRLRCAEGINAFTLEGVNTLPAEWEVAVEGTAPDFPLELEFAPADPA